jgi:hypothetical protein
MSDAAPPEVLEKVVAPWISTGILEQGYYHLGGHVARAVDVAGLTPSQLLDAWGLRYDGSPFPGDAGHVDVLRFPVHPLMLLSTPADATPRPWPTYPNGFLGGPNVVPVWRLDRTRVPIGGELWRRSTTGDELLASFEGPAMGWRGSRGYFPPVHFVGTRAKWSELDLPAEISRDGTSVELVSVSAAAPVGFDQVRPEVWRRVVLRAEVDQLFELVLTCTYEGVPCRILQHTPAKSRVLLLTDDPEDARRLAAEEADIGAFELTVDTAKLTDVGGTTRELANVN